MSSSFSDCIGRKQYDEGFIGRREAAYGNAEIWERVLGWLDAYLERS